MSNHLKPKLKPAPQSVARAKDRIREITHRGRGRNIVQVIKEVNRFLRGWVGYFRLSTVKQAFVTLDQWIRRRLRKILWEQWKKPRNPLRKARKEARVAPRAAQTPLSRPQAGAVARARKPSTPTCSGRNPPSRPASARARPATSAPR